MHKTLLAAVVLIAGAANASGAILYSTSFEAPAFTAGASVNGIDGWANGSGTGVSQTVTSTQAFAGTQSLFFDNTGANNSFYSVRHAMPAFGSDTVTLSLQMYITSGSGGDRIAEVSFTNSATGTLGAAILGLSIDGAGNVRMGTVWSALYGGTGTPVGTAAAGTYADRWLTAVLTYNPSTQTGTTTLSGFGGAASSYSSSFTVTAIPANFNLGSDYNTTTARAGSVYFDNLSVSTPVPEPGTMALLGVAGGALLLRRQRSGRTGK